MKKIVTLTLLMLVCLTTASSAQLDRFGFLRRFRPQVSVPPPWNQATIGSGLPLQGSTMYNSGVFAIQGAGSNFGTTDTGLHYVYQSTSGDMQIVANVSDCDILSGGGEQCGLMYRKSLDSGSANFSCFRQENAPQLRIVQWRDTDGGTTDSDGFAADGDNWLRIQKLGDDFSCWESDNGTDWTQVGMDETIVMDANYFIGMFVNSNDTGELAAGTFSSVTVQETDPDTDLILSFDRTNPFWWDNDSERDGFTWLFVLAAASNGNLNLIGASRSPNPYGFNPDPEELTDLAQAAINDGWNIDPSLLTNIATNLDTKYITALLKPDGMSGCDPDTDGGIDCIDDTVPIDEAPANALKDAVLMYGTHNKPMVVGAGGALTTVASAYLLAVADGMGTEFIDRVIVISDTGADVFFPELKDYNSQQDEWALFIVMNKLRHVITPFNADMLTEVQGQQLWDFVAAAPGEVGDFVRDIQDNWWPAAYPMAAMQGDGVAVMPVLYPIIGDFFLNPIQRISPTNVWGAWPPGYPDHGAEMLNLQAYQAVLSVEVDPMGNDQYINGYDSDFFVTAFTSELQEAFGIANSPPTITLSPSPSGPYIAPATVTINPTAADSDGSVVQIDYYDASDDTLLDTVFDGSPYVYSALPIGTYSIYAIATDDDSDTTQSNTIFFTVGIIADGGGYRSTFTGFGYDSLGGRGNGTASNICHVTSLDDTAGSATFTGAVDGGGNYTGTFRQCATGLSAPRFVVFDVCGTIQLTADIEFTDPYMTVAGQTACGEGITFKLAGGGIDHFRIFINTHNLIFQHVRFRGGSTSPASIPGGTDMIRMGGATSPPLGTADHIVFDHVTFSWALHIMAWSDQEAASNIGFYDSMFYEGLNSNTVVNQTMAALFYKNSECSVTIQRSIFAHNAIRNPLVGNGCKISFINNTVYNYGSFGETEGQYSASMWGSYATCDNVDPCPDPTGPDVGPFEAVWIGNTYYWGDDTGSDVQIFKQKFGEKAFPPYAATPSRVWMLDNLELKQDRVTHGRMQGATQNGQWAGVEACLGVACGGGFVNGVSTNDLVDDVNCTLVGGFGIRETNPSCISWYDGHDYNPMPQATAHAYVLNNAGAFPAFRDYQDDRIANPTTGEIATGTGNQISNSAQGQAVKANLSFTGADGFPNLTTDTSAYSNPASPWSGGSCGSAQGRGARWVIECNLESLAQSVEGASGTQDLTFTPDTTSLIPNPETGPFWEYQNSGSEFRSPGLRVHTDLGTPQALRPFGVTTVYASYWIGDFYTDEVIPTPFTQEFLDQLEDDFAAARENGLKLILGFHYACGWHDPPKAQIIAHTEQVGAIALANADSMLAMDWGMAGPCGEYGVSQPNYNFGDDTLVCNEITGAMCERIRWQNDNTIDIVDAWLANTPTDRMILYNSDLKRSYVTYSSGLHDDPQPVGPYVPGALGDTTLTAAEAFTGTAKARIGFENQCFLTDFTSYVNRPWATGPTDYMAVEGKYVPQIYFPDTHCGQTPTDAELLTEVNAGHWDLVSGETYINWISQSGWSDPRVQDFFRQNGYRYRLVSAQIPLSATSGIDNYPVHITITNDNPGMIFNPRKIELILRNQSSGITYVTDYDGDGKGNQSMFPAQGASRTWDITASLASVPAGNYDLILNLPDPYPSIHDDPLFSIQLANVGTWEAMTGYNILSTSVVID